MFYLNKVKQFFIQLAEKIELQSVLQNQLAEKIELQSVLQNQLAEKIELQSVLQNQLAEKIDSQDNTALMLLLSQQYSRNFLPSDDAAMQKTLITAWKVDRNKKIGYEELLDSGFRVFSQNDEDGSILRILTQIGVTNKYVIEIGSNTSSSNIDIPENLSTNLFINHGWHGCIFEMDEVECSKMINFYANNLATKHFHVEMNGQNSYFSPQVIVGAIDIENINSKVTAANVPREPDLMIIDIDGGDLDIIKSLKCIKPRVLVVEFEKRFKDRFSVVQKNKDDFSLNWAQSGAASLPAWEAVLAEKGYILCGVNMAGFNAFFVRSDVAVDKIDKINSTVAFKAHPIFSNMIEDFWLKPDDTWEEVIEISLELQ